MRATHLQAHMRSHMDDTLKPFVCPHDGCEKRFWTSQHLHRHIVSCHTTDTGVAASDAQALLGDASTSGLYRCDRPSCQLLFSKRKHLRQHIRDVHADTTNATLPYPCDVPGCDKRFATHAKREHHRRVHDQSRYQCFLPHPAPPPPGHPPYTVDATLPSWTFATWTHLQRHQTLYHPPTCAQCGRVFANRENLRRHMRTHDPSARWDSEWVCPWNGCDKVFQSHYALKTHISRVHENERPFVCDTCGERFGYKHLLARHIQARHAAAPALASPTDDAPSPLPHVSRLLGNSAGRQRSRRERVLSCPWPSLGEGNAACPRHFARLYDVRRHLHSVHHVDLSDEELRAVMPTDALVQLPAPRAAKRIRTD
ncbi:RNA polymerase II transcription regulator [Malassezia pachydermatis]